MYVMDEILKMGAKMKEDKKYTGVKHDNKKEDLSLINKCMIDACARAMTYGKYKYGRDNYKGGLKYTRVIAALLRHTYAFLECEEKDEESGLCHLDHIAACVNMLSFMFKNYPDLDDRYKGEKS